jgi:hypothetical protein
MILPTWSPRITRGGGGGGSSSLEMKHSAFIESQKKVKNSSFLDGTYEKATGKVYSEFSTPIIIRSGSRSLFVLKVLLIIKS